jgi:uncharacterized protein YqhQ
MPSVEPPLGFVVGGQAVIEGVMMRAPGGYCVAVRKPKGEIVFDCKKIPEKKWKIPILRGTFVFFHALVLGIRALNFSASVVEEEGEGKDAPAPLSKWAIAGSMGVALVFGIAIFVVLPLALTHWMKVKGSVAFNLVDGGIRLVLFFLYLGFITLFKDIRRIFAYHGAEHKVVHPYEAREDLTLENARAKSTLHPRCGTSFLLFVVVVSIFCFAFIPQTSPFYVKFGMRLLLLPLIGGISYELIRLSHALRNTLVGKAMAAPGMGLQRITTREPDDAMLEVAIRSLQSALDVSRA